MLITHKKLLVAVVMLGSCVILLTVATLFNDSIDFQTSIANAYQQLNSQFQKISGSIAGAAAAKGWGHEKDESHGSLKADKEVDLSPEKNPLLDKGNLEPEGTLVRPGEHIPSGSGANSTEGSTKVKATLLSLVRNSELRDLLGSVIQIEATFNEKFHYPWTFFNDDDFSEEFKTEIRQVTSSECEFVKIDPEDWEEPEWIDRDMARELGEKMQIEEDVQHANQQSYHRMCRWNSGKFYSNPAMDKYDYYWRVEPKTRYYCSIDYDVFAYMQMNDKEYGFVINLYDSPQSIRTLWPTTEKFFGDHPEYVHPNNSMQWLLQRDRDDHNAVTSGYSTCHFWSNFEIGHLGFYRSKGYQEYFDYLDHSGGFFYERWGDAPVHSVALGIMADKSKIHYFKDIGYFHPPYYNCPDSDKCGGCKAGQFSEYNNLNPENCLEQWFKAAGAG